MVDKVSNTYLPDYTVPPGETLKEILANIPMTQAALAQRMGRTPKMINEIISGKAPITPETALLLAQVLGVPARLWNNLERNYQLMNQFSSAPIVAGERCQRCDCLYSDVWITSADIWQRVTGREDGLFCMPCFAVMANLRGIVLYWECGEGVYPGRHHPYYESVK